MDTLATVTAVAAARAVTAAHLAGNGREAPAAMPAAAASDRTELSAGGRLVEALQTGDTQASATAMTAAPLLPFAPASGPQALLAQALERGLRQSGLFYESHQAAWVQGDYPLDALLLEPQARLPALPPLVADVPAPRPAALPDGAGVAPGRTSAPAAGQVPLLPATAMGAGTDAWADAAGATRWPAEVDPRAGALVQQQLQALDSRVVPWHGQVWPGQMADWTVAAHVDPDQQGPDQPPHAWTSRLKLELPSLGAVDAELQWKGSRCSLYLTVPAARLPQIRAALPALAQALATAGIRPLRIQAGAPRNDGSA